MSDAVAAQMNQSYTYFGFSACSAPKVSDNLSRPLLPQVTQMMSCQIQRKPFNGQLSLTLTRTLTMIDCIPSIAVCVSLCVCEPVCVFVNNNFWLVFEAHWPTVYGGIALCARIWRQWRQWTTTTIRWEREYDALLLTTTLTPAQTQQLPHTHTHTRAYVRRSFQICGRRRRPVKS